MKDELGVERIVLAMFTSPTKDILQAMLDGKPDQTRIIVLLGEQVQ